MKKVVIVGYNLNKLKYQGQRHEFESWSAKASKSRGPRFLTAASKLLSSQKVGGLTSRKEHLHRAGLIFFEELAFITKCP